VFLQPRGVIPEPHTPVPAVHGRRSAQPSRVRHTIYLHVWIDLAFHPLLDLLPAYIVLVRLPPLSAGVADGITKINYIPVVLVTSVVFDGLHNALGHEGGNVNEAIIYAVGRVAVADVKEILLAGSDARRHFFEG